MKYDEVIKDFRELYRERTEHYIERYIQRCYLEWCKKNKHNNGSFNGPFFEIDLNEFIEWLELETELVDKNNGVSNTAKKIKDIYKTSTADVPCDRIFIEEPPLDEGLSLHEDDRILNEETKCYWGHECGLTSTARIRLERNGSSFVITEESINLAKNMAHAIMNGQPIPLRNGDNSIFIGDGELFYVNPARTELPDEVLPPRESKIEKEKLSEVTMVYSEKGGNDEISRIGEDGVVVYYTKIGTYLEVMHISRVLSLKDENGNMRSDFSDIFKIGSRIYSKDGLPGFAKLKPEDTSKMASLLRKVLEETSRSFVQFEKETELRKKLEELEASLEGKEASISALGEESETGKSKIDTLVSENGRLTEENGTLRKKQQEQIAQIQTLQRNNGQLETRAKQAEENSDTLRQRMEQLKQKVMQAVGKVPFVGKRIKAIFDEDVYTLPSQTQKKDDFRASLQMTEASTDDTERVSKEQAPSTRNRTDRSEEDELNL